MWRWRGVTNVFDFGNPVTSTRYELCIYDGAGLAVTLEEIGWNCTKRLGCWHVKANGFRYGTRTLNPQQIGLTGGDGKRDNILVRDRHAAVTSAALPLALPVTVQWFDTTNNVCWAETYTPSDTKENTENQFKALRRY